LSPGGSGKGAKGNSRRAVGKFWLLPSNSLAIWASNPEELIAAAHAACFSMALSAQLGSAGLTPEKIATTATVTFENRDQGWTVTESHLEVSATIPGTTPEAFARLAQDAKAGCPISRLLNTTITMDAKLTA